MNQDNGNREFWQVLLKGKVAINSYEGVELSLRQAQKFSIRDASPPLIVNRARIETRDIRYEASVDALVE